MKDDEFSKEINMALKKHTQRGLTEYYEPSLSEKSDHQLTAHAASSELGINSEKETEVAPSIYDEPEVQSPIVSPKISSDATDISSPPYIDRSLNEKSLASVDYEDAIAIPPQSISDRSDTRQDGSPLGEARDVEAPPPNERQSQTPRKQGWRTPRQNVWRMGHVCLAFLNFGLNDASNGVCPFSCPFLKGSQHLLAI